MGNETKTVEQDTAHEGGQVTSQALERQQTVSGALVGIVPRSVGELQQLALFLHKSAALPTSAKNNPETVGAIIMAGLEIGLTPIRSLQNLVLIKGNLAMKADLQLAVVRKSGLLAFYDEGYEVKGKTDGTLALRLGAEDPDMAVAVTARVLHAKITAALAELGDGKPYGWAIAQRTGDTQKHVKVFSWADADRVTVPKRDESGDGDGDGERQWIKLHQKHNYVNWPDSMYPRRARVRVLALTHSDAVAGIPAVESIEHGQVFEAEFRRDDAPDLDERLADIDQELAKQIMSGFDNLRYSHARRLQLLVQWQGDPSGLLTWLRAEYETAVQGKAQPRTERPQAPDQRRPDTEHGPQLLDGRFLPKGAVRLNDEGHPVDGKSRKRWPKWKEQNPVPTDGQVIATEPAKPAAVDVQAAPAATAPMAKDPEPPRPAESGTKLADAAAKFAGSF